MMSSEISTDNQALHPWQLFMLAGLVGATTVVFMARHVGPAAIILLSFTVIAAAFVGIATWRTLSPLAGRDEPAAPEILGGRTRAALEREKTLVLRSLKDLEFDRSMGKVSEKDFAEMSVRLRARAVGLLRQLDSGTSYRSEIEKELERRVGVVPAKPHARTCACGVTNDPDAKFCKSCGTKLTEVKLTDAGADLHPSTNARGALSEVDGQVGPGQA